MEAMMDTSPQSAINGKVLNIDNMNPHVKKMEYAVRGPIVARAAAIEKELEQVGISV